MKRLAGALAATLFGVLLSTTAQAQKIGVLGDSLSDEYQEDTFGVYAQTWTEQLMLYTPATLGRTAVQAGQPGGTWGEPRRTQYEYNWARVGATSGDLLSMGQHTGLAAQVASEPLGYAVMSVGANDFNPASTAYFSIYFGFWSQTTINNYVNGILVNINTALDAVQPTGVNIVLTNALDFGVTPAVQALFGNASRRQRVADAIIQLNAGIRNIAMARQLTLVDMYGVSLAVFGTHANPKTTLLIGNVPIDLTQGDTPSGGNPTAAFVDDDAHPNTTLHGLFYNLMATAMNGAYGAHMPIFSETQILAHRGIPYGGADTLPAQLGDYSDYVFNYAPLPIPSLSFIGTALLSLLLLGAAVLTLRHRF